MKISWRRGSGVGIGISIGVWYREIFGQVLLALSTGAVVSACSNRTSCTHYTMPSAIDNMHGIPEGRVAKRQKVSVDGAAPVATPRQQARVGASKLFAPYRVR